MAGSDNQLTPVCEHCGKGFSARRRDARYCSPEHKAAAAQKRRRSRERVNRRRRDIPLSILEEFDSLDAPETSQDDDDDEFAWVDQGYRDEVELDAALSALAAHYESLKAPYLAQLRRNPGRKPDALIELENQHAAIVDSVIEKRARAWAIEREIERRADPVAPPPNRLSNSVVEDFARDLGRRAAPRGPFDLTDRR